MITGSHYTTRHEETVYRDKNAAAQWFLSSPPAERDRALDVDRGLISITDDPEILISRHVNDTAGVRAMINKTRRILTPSRAGDKPHPHFLRWHRENCFKA
jgi:hypothetical protein